MDDDSDTEREALLDENSSDDEYNKKRRRLKYASSSDYDDEDNAEDFDGDDDIADDEGDALLASDKSNDEHKDSANERQNANENSPTNICHLSNENIVCETLESPTKQIDIASEYQLGDDISVKETPDKMTSGDSGKSSPNPDNENEKQQRLTNVGGSRSSTEDISGQITNLTTKEESDFKAVFDKPEDVIEPDSLSKKTDSRKSSIIKPIDGESEQPKSYIELEEIKQDDNADSSKAIDYTELYNAHSDGLILECQVLEVITGQSNEIFDDASKESLKTPDSERKLESKAHIYSTQSDEFKAHGGSAENIYEFTAESVHELLTHGEDEIKEHSGSTANLLESTRSESNESSEQQVLHNGGKVKAHFGSCQHLIHHVDDELCASTRDNSTETIDQQLLPHFDNKFMGQSRSTKNVFEFPRSKSAGCDGGSLLPNNRNTFKTASVSIPNRLESIRAAATASNEERKARSGSTKNDFESAESNEQLLHHYDNKLSDSFGSTENVFQITEIDDRMFTNNLDELKSPSESTKNVSELPKECIENSEPLFSNNGNDLKTCFGSTKNVFDSVRATTTEIDDQLLTTDNDKLSTRIESTTNAFELSRSESAGSDEQLIPTNVKELKSPSESTKNLFESSRASSAESDDQLLTQNDDELMQESGRNKNVFKATRSDSTESGDQLLHNNNAELKDHFGSTKKLFKTTKKPHSIESDHQMFPSEDEITSPSRNAKDLFIFARTTSTERDQKKCLDNESEEHFCAESTKHDQLWLPTNDDDHRLLSITTKHIVETVGAVAGDSVQQNIPNNETKTLRESCNDLVRFTNIEVTENEEQLFLINKLKAHCGSANNLFEFKNDERNSELVNNKGRSHSRSTSDLFGLTRTTSTTGDQQLLSKEHSEVTKGLAEVISTESFENVDQQHSTKYVKPDDDVASGNTNDLCDFQDFNAFEGQIVHTTEEKRDVPNCNDNLLYECPKGSLDLHSSGNDVHVYSIPELESGYFEKTDSVHSKDDESKEPPSTSQHHQYNQAISESLRNQLNRFDLLIDTIDQRNARNMATNAAERGYWSTIFGQASEIEDYDEISAERKAHRALELLEDYHSRLSEPQDRALRIAIERVIRIFKSRLFQALLARDFMQAYKQQSNCISHMVKMLQQLKEENWCLPVMYTACLDLRILAQRCEELGNSSKPGEILEKAADCLMSCFRVCAADNRSSDNETKRLGMLHLVNQLFKVYFRINKLHLCKPLIRAIDSSAFKDVFPLPERITYKYFVGRKAMFDSDYKSADEFLSFAFKHCPKNFPRNKRLILIYLVPVKMLLGFLPKKYILERYDVLQFHELAEALKEGNVRKFDDVIQRHETFFIKCGIYLLVEKLIFIVYRNLFKKVYIIKQTHQLDLNAFRSALQYVGETDMTIDETHCIVANLIYEGKIKGYISHSHNKLVVSKQNPFPPLNTVS